MVLMLSAVRMVMSGLEGSLRNTGGVCIAEDDTQAPVGRIEHEPCRHQGSQAQHGKDEQSPRMPCRARRFYCSPEHRLHTLPHA
jgi:hypothetical protein